MLSNLRNLLVVGWFLAACGLVDEPPPSDSGGDGDESTGDGDDEVDACGLKKRDDSKINSYCQVDTDFDGDGTVEAVLRVIRDEAGRALEERVENLQDNNITTTTYSYDSAGHLIEEVQAADRVLSVRQWVYEGDLLVLGRLDENGDGIIDSQTTKTHDENGRELCSENFSHDMVEQKRCHTYDENGLRVLTELDTLGDGTIDSIQTYIYQNGIQTSITVDMNADGVLDIVVTYELGEDGRTTEVFTWIDAQGEPTQMERRIYDSCDFGLYYSNDTNADGINEQISEAERNEFGDLTHLSSDSDGDGTPNLTVEYSYNADGHVLRSETDQNGDGTLEQIEVVTYDEQGFILREETSLISSGILNTQTYLYDCVDP